MFSDSYGLTVNVTSRVPIGFGAEIVKPDETLTISALIVAVLGEVPMVIAHI